MGIISQQSCIARTSIIVALLLTAFQAKLVWSQTTEQQAEKALVIGLLNFRQIVVSAWSIASLGYPDLVEEKVWVPETSQLHS